MEMTKAGATMPTKDEITEKIAENIRRFKEETKISCSEFEAKTGIRFNTLSAYEYGKNPPNVYNLCKIAVALGVTPNDLLSWEVKGNGNDEGGGAGNRL